jgi:hypothetical protein
LLLCFELLIVEVVEMHTPIPKPFYFGKITFQPPPLKPNASVYAVAVQLATLGLFFFVCSFFYILFSIFFFIPFSFFKKDIAKPKPRPIADAKPLVQPGPKPLPTSDVVVAIAPVAPAAAPVMPLNLIVGFFSFFCLSISFFL